jgi:N-acetylglucosamine-6-phosphate deacetylase
MPQVFRADAVFDGRQMHVGGMIAVENGRVAAILTADDQPRGRVQDLGPGVIAPAFLDLQVNGGGGRMVDGQTGPDDLARLCALHRGLGSAGILPTLITDRPEAVNRVIGAGVAAAKAQVPGFLGLHLEGPHLDVRRKGAHDPALIRPMSDADLAILCQAAADLPALMVTLAPASVTPAQIAALTAAGVIVSLGHSDCTRDEARAAMAAGATCTTHLFNAMSQIGNREPGLAGAVLSGPGFAGLIADGVHVDVDVMRLALAARAEGIFLVSDCMAFAGSELTEVTLGGRRILRRDGRLTLEDGTLAGADLTLDQAVGVLVERVGIAPERALAMASALPARVIGQQDRHGHLAPGRDADFVHLGPDWRLRGAWYGGEPA